MFYLKKHTYIKNVTNVLFLKQVFYLKKTHIYLKCIYILFSRRQYDKHKPILFVFLYFKLFFFINWVIICLTANLIETDRSLKHFF